MSTITVRMLRSDEAHLLNHALTEVFDGPLSSVFTAEFFTDARHHLAVALDGVAVVGMVSGVHYLHPNKPPELFINELSVAPAYQGQQLGKRLIATLLTHARRLGCVAAWVLTEESNAAARRLYLAAGGEEQAGVVMSLFTL